MAFNSWQEIIWMDGYGFYVWLSFGVSILAVGLLVVHGLLTRKTLARMAVQEQQRQQRLARRKQQERSRSKSTNDSTS
ncbi:heme exporter protein CcmD [Pseudidiomarina gelatinasegens]|jgi:heme exporter protein D|uniref:Heme exporter protein D n=1 Tax=Pseudidiomarina gelatinasegens TaxID=2487740 RepID=A0A443Z7P8_9GAMM|nr:heme exporter protein CcmD [Pseudidiomarina gelatinasegens]RWU12891.1 heme exporter protein CcmD [Pseudidiomarina gelatinasegens]